MADPSASPPRELDYVAAFLSYLFPGLGQVIQGRIAKGLMFFVCLYGLFFYGLSLGQMRNVWLPDARTLPDADVAGNKLHGLPKAIYYRPQFVGQFWIGVAAWPAAFQYLSTTAPDPTDAKDLPVIGGYMRTPTEEELNTLQRDGNKRWDLGWVYTLIAGVLNVLVIYDALAGPAVRNEDETAEGRPTPAGGAA